MCMPGGLGSNFMVQHIKELGETFVKSIDDGKRILQAVKLPRSRGQSDYAASLSRDVSSIRTRSG